MTYTTHGLMTHTDLIDLHELHDTAPDPNCPGHRDGRCTVAMDCPGRAPHGAMGTYRRMQMYVDQSATGRMTARQRRRLVKKAGRDPEYTVIRDTGMGYSPAMQGYREITLAAMPTSGAPY